MASEQDLSVAIIGPSGPCGSALMSLLQADPRVRRVVGIAAHAFDRAQPAWSKLEYHRADVRDQAALEAAFAGADVVVHLALPVFGAARGTTRAGDVEATLHAFRAAVGAGARRFVHACSRPVGDRLLDEQAARHPGVSSYLVRTPIVLAPGAAGGDAGRVRPVSAIARALGAGARRLPLPVPVPDLPVQLIHHDDVAEALRRCVVGAGPPGAYNVAAADVLSLADVIDEYGVTPLPVSARPARAVARMAARLPLRPLSAQWVEAVSRPVVMDTDRAKTELGWRPSHTARETLRVTFT